MMMGVHNASIHRVAGSISILMKICKRIVQCPAVDVSH